MSYFYDNKIYDDYIIDGVINPGETKTIVKDVIEIFNNERLRFNFSNLDFRCSNPSVENQELTKIVIDWGDGSVDRLSKSLMNKSSSIGTYDPISWKQATHLYNVDKRYEYDIADQENLIAVLPKIVITLINTYNDRVVIYIPYKIVYKSLYDIGSHFSLLEANVTNSNLTSYVLKEHKDDTIIITSTRDWKKIYGNSSQIVTIKDDNISTNFSDQFVNEDSIVWDWKSVPEVDLTVKNSTEGQTNIVYFYCSFNEITVNLDTWTPKCFKIQDVNKELVVNYNDINKQLNIFRIYNYDGLDKKDLENGVYKTYLDVVGINDVAGSSSPVYNSVPEDVQGKPAKLLTNKLINESNITNKTFNLNFALGKTTDNFQYDIYPQMIKEAVVTLKPTKIGNEVADSEIRFEYDLKQHLSEGTLEILTKSIPNGTYTYSSKVLDVLGNEISTLYSDMYTQLKPSSFTINYSNFGTVNDITSSVTDNQVFFNWKVKEATQFDDIEFRLYSTNQGAKEYLFNEKQAYDKFPHTVISNNEIHFNKKYTPQQIKDGSYTIQVSHVLNMTSYGGDRRHTVSQPFEFEYPKPNVQIINVIPYVKINRNNSAIFQPYMRIRGKEANNNELMDISFNHRLKEAEVYSKTPVQSLTVDYPISSLGTLNSETEYEFDFSSYKAKDAVLKRTNTLWTNEKNKSNLFKKLTNKSLDTLLLIPPTEENIEASSTRYTREDEPNSSLTPKDVILQSVVDINKTHTFTHDGRRYYFADNDGDCLVYKWGDKNKPLVFGTRQYTSIVAADSDQTPEQFVRFCGYPIDITPDGISQLYTAEAYFKNDIIMTKSYNKNYDNFNVLFSLKDGLLKNQLYKETMLAKFEMIDVLTDQVVYTGDFRKGLNGKLAYDIPLGAYDIKWTFDSLYTKSAPYNTFRTSYKENTNLKLFVQPEDTIGDVEVAAIPLGDSDYSLISVSWKLFHTYCSNLTLHIQEVNGQKFDIYVQPYKYYNPTYEFKKGANVKIWFTMQSDRVNWKSGSGKDKIQQQTYVIS